MTAALAQTRWFAGVARAAAASGIGGPRPSPLVAVLCTEPRRRVAAAGVALALAPHGGCALAGAVGEGLVASIGGTPRARRVARSVRERGVAAAASGRLVWLADRRGPQAPEDVVGRAAAMSAELGRLATFVGVPAAVALPFARTPALDRVLAWHDAIIVVREPDAPAAMLERALASLAELGRPVAAMAPPPRLPGVLAVGGLRAPAEALGAIAELNLGSGSSRDA